MFNKLDCWYILYLLRTSLLYVPPYLFLCAANSVISGIQLANTAYTQDTDIADILRMNFNCLTII